MNGSMAETYLNGNKFFFCMYAISKIIRNRRNI